LALHKLEQLEERPKAGTSTSPSLKMSTSYEDHRRAMPDGDCVVVNPGVVVSVCEPKRPSKKQSVPL